jgi:hypothetical protein
MLREVRLVRTLFAASLSCAALAAACKSTEQAPPPSPRAQAPAFHVSAAPAGECTHGADCVIAIRLAAEGDYHVNPEYPFRFAPDGDASTVGVRAEPFVREGEKTGTLRLRFLAAEARRERVAGVLKLSVCSSETCKIEEENVQVDVDVR